MTNEIKEKIKYLKTYASMMQSVYLTEIEDYITNLQEKYEEADNDRHKLFEQKEKAIEYIDNHTIEWIDKHFEEHNVMVAFNEYSNPQALKDILQGEDK